MAQSHGLVAGVGCETEGRWAYGLVEPRLQRTKYTSAFLFGGPWGPLHSSSTNFAAPRYRKHAGPGRRAGAFGKSTLVLVVCLHPGRFFLRVLLVNLRLASGNRSEILYGRRGGSSEAERDGVAAAARVRHRGRRVRRLMARQAPPLPRLRRARHCPRPK